MTEEQRFDSIYRILVMSGEYENKEYLIEDQVHEIMDNPHIYPEYFWWQTIASELKPTMGVWHFGMRNQAQKLLVNLSPIASTINFVDSTSKKFLLPLLSN